MPEMTMEDEFYLSRSQFNIPDDPATRLAFALGAAYVSRQTISSALVDEIFQFSRKALLSIDQPKPFIPLGTDNEEIEVILNTSEPERPF